MTQSVTVVSALSAHSLIQDLLLQRISTYAFVETIHQLDTEVAVKIGDSTLLLLIPILGDNDLSPKIEDSLKALLVNTKGFSGRKVLVVLKGDRHSSDEFLTESHPIYTRLFVLFRHLKNLWICTTKLDADTANDVAEKVINALDSPAPFCPEVEEMAYVLGSTPLWNISDRRLDFFDTSSGRSILFQQSNKVLNHIGSITRKLKPKKLILRGGYLDNSIFASGILERSATHIDLSSNRILPKKLDASLEQCQWLNLAANDLEAVDLSALPPSLITLRLDKNSLCEIGFETLKEGNLRKLSLYRNNLTQLNISQIKLNYLNIGANPISVLPDSLSESGLCSIGLARTKITRLPEWIVESTTLKTIDISYIEDSIPSAQLKQLVRQVKFLITRPGFTL